MNNFPVIYKGKEYWISRAIAVVIKVIGYDKFNKPHILAVQRGKGTPDPEFIGSWCLPCGYLDFDETIKEGACREIFEETGIALGTDALISISINDDPTDDKRQNVIFRFKTYLPYKIEYSRLSNEFSEKDEVSNIRWIPVNEIDKYDWAFNHKKLIREI